MNASENYSADKPISNKDDDKFQRFEFSKRVAKTIIDRRVEDCIVIGIYGAWGEGKTSVINFIEQELKLNNTIIAMKFNPWRYGDENSLLRQFFHQFANALDSQLNTKSEKAGDLISRYGKLLNFDIPLIGNIGEAVQGAGEVMASVDIENLKERIEKIIKDSKKKIVVFIDDIDRLDKMEIYSIFRLVKLNADFKNVSYILCFDEEMVASAIGDRFGSGNQEAGKNFLEKIVQVPLNIPVAQPEDLKNYCFRLLEEVINSNAIEISDDDLARFSDQFSTNILGRLQTPRLAVRYSNGLAFSLPLLNGEVNPVDLMLIEAIKIFYPNYYKFIKENPEFFLTDYQKKYSSTVDAEKIQEVKEHFTTLNKDYSKKQRIQIKDLLICLFPTIENVFRSVGYPDKTYEKWTKEKRIASNWYFNRYFSYSVIRGEISDIVFNDFLNKVPHEDVNVLANEIRELVKESSADKFVFKVRIIENELEWNVAKKIVKAISAASEVFSENPKSGFFFAFDSPQAQIAIFIKRLIINSDDKEQQYQLAYDLLKESKDIFFADELRKWFSRTDRDTESLFNESQISDLTSILLRRAKEEAGDIPIFVKFPEQADYLLIQWHKEDPNSFKNYIKNLLSENPKLILDLISSFAPRVRSSSHPEPYKTDFSIYEFEQLAGILDAEFIIAHIEKIMPPDELIKEVIWTGRDGGLSDEMIALQFRHFAMTKPS